MALQDVDTRNTVDCRPIEQVEDTKTGKFYDDVPERMGEIGCYRIYDRCIRYEAQGKLQVRQDTVLKRLRGGV